MRAWHHAAMIGIAGLMLLMAGCATAARPSMLAVNPLDVLEKTVVQNPADNNYVLTRMEFARTAIMLGAYDRAQPKLNEARDQLESEHANVGAALSSERLKYYKGETYERAMLYCYLGYIKYSQGQYNEARICFERALTCDQGAVVKDATPEIYGQDFGLAYYWLGKTYARLLDADNCAIAFKKAGVDTPRKEAVAERKSDQQRAQRMVARRAEGERWAYRTFHDVSKPKLYVEAAVDLSEPRPMAEVVMVGDTTPARSAVLRFPAGQEELLTAGYQQQTNTTLTIEVGRCPHKYLTGLHNERTEIGRSFTLPADIRVYVDGQAAGSAVEVLDLWEQSATQDRIVEKDAAQTAKAILKEVWSHTPYAGWAASYWDVSGDMRYWTSLPGRVYQYAAQLAPGVHTIRLEMRDANGNLLPRWTNTYYGVRVPDAGEVCALLEPRFDADNLLPPQQREMAMAAGARTWSE